MYDLIIIGAGPAGITASVYAARKRLNTLVISMDIGGQTAWSGDIENYTGYQFISGPELAAKFEEHMRKYGINLKEKEEVLEINKNGQAISIRTEKGSYEARTVIIASGKKSRMLNVPGEAEFKNKGLTYCATCDAPLFANKTVAVIGCGNSGLDAAIQLIKIAEKIYLVNNGPQLTGDPIMREQVEASEKIQILNNAQVLSVSGEKFVTGLKIKHGQEEKLLAVQGIFVEIGLVPNTGFAKELKMNEYNEIVVNSRNETNIPGVFAAGDVTDVPEKQIIIAAGEGAKAALGAFRYLIQHKFN